MQLPSFFPERFEVPSSRVSDSEIEALLRHLVASHRSEGVWGGGEWGGCCLVKMTPPKGRLKAGCGAKKRALECLSTANALEKNVWPVLERVLGKLAGVMRRALLFGLRALD
jgi:hypothetical protein